MKTVKVTKDNIDSLLNGDKPVLLDFWAVWCGPCQMMGPILDDFAAAHDDIVVGKVNVDEEMDLAMKYVISAVPTLKLFKDGEEKVSHAGVCDPEKLLERIK